MVSIILLLGACEEKSDLTTSELISKVQDQIEEVKSYSSELNIDTEVKDLSNDNFINQSTVSLDIDMVEPTTEIKGKKLENGHMLAHYTTDGGSYVRDGEEDWEDVSEERKQFKNEATSYAETAQTIINLQDIEDVKVSMKDKNYIISYKGKSIDVFEAFEEPFALELVDIDPADMEQDVYIVINNDSFAIEEISNTLTAEIDGKSLLLSVSKVYDQLNEIESIDIPKGVIDEATSEPFAFQK